MRGRKALGLGLLLLCGWPTGAGAENKSKLYEAAQARAVELASIFNGGALHFHAEVLLYPEGMRHRAVEGEFDYVQASKDESRQEFRFGSFDELDVITATARYRSSTTAFEPLMVAEARELMFAPVHLADKMLVTSIEETERLDGSTQQCFLKKVTERVSQRICFDKETGSLTDESFTAEGIDFEFQYSKPIRDGDHVYAGFMRRFEKGSLRCEVKITKIDHEAAAAAAFEAAKNSESLPVCRKFEPASFDVSRDFLMPEGHSLVGGTVVVAMKLDAHGRMGDSEIQQTVDSRTDSIALKKLGRLKFQAARCDGHAIPSLMRVWITFAPDARITRLESLE